MEVKAYFSNIRFHLSNELKAASGSIYVAVAWFTDAKLFDILCQKAKDGLDVQLMVMDDDITQNCMINYKVLEASGGRLYMIDPGFTGVVMHHKFCVIDGNTTITGSYNWSYKAQSNHENITITKDDVQLAEMFLTEFKNIKEQYHGKEPLKQFDSEILSRRLLIIENLIQLGEHENIPAQVAKIKEYEMPPEIISIINLLDDSEFEKASELIRDFARKLKSLTVFIDTDLEQLRWEIKYLEVEIVALESEKSIIEKIISDFIQTYTVEFGELLIKILKLKAEKLKKEGHTKRSEEYQEAERKYQEEREKYKEAKKSKSADLTDDEQEELKQIYRKAAMLCHPDRFTDEEAKLKAQKVFVELQDAYSKSDLKKVRAILENLEKGIYEIDETIGISTREQLLARIAYLKARLDEITLELIRLRNDKTYKDILSIKNMSNFFEDEKVRLENEIKELENEQR